MSQLDKNTATLQELIEIANALPEAGAALPELTNPGYATGLELGKELIDADGNIVVGKLHTNMVMFPFGWSGVAAEVTQYPTSTDDYFLKVTRSLGTAETDHVLEGYTYTSDASPFAGASGEMPNRGAVTATLNTSTTSYTIPEGYHNGSGKVSITTETKTATPTKSTQNIVPTSGKVLSKVTVNPIPSQYADVSATTLNNPEDVSAGVTFYTNTGDLYTGIFRKDFVRAQNVNQSMDNFTIPVKQATNGTNAYLQIDTHGSTPALGDAVAGNVLAGKSFTSDNGLLLEGTLEVPDLSVVTAEAIDVVKGKTIIGSDGSSISGKLDTSGINISGYTISAELYKNSFAGDGSYILKTTGSVGDAPAENVLEGTTFTSDYSGINVAGTMPNNGAVSLSLDPFGSADSSVAIPVGYHNGSGKVTLADNLRTELNNINGNTSTSVLGAVTNISGAVDDQASLISQIQTALQGKATGGGSDIPMCELTVEHAHYVDYVTVENGVITTKTSTGVNHTSNHTSLSVCQGSIVVIRIPGNIAGNHTFPGVTTIYKDTESIIFCINNGTEEARLVFSSSGGGLD